jgi:hypothetical protein
VRRGLRGATEEHELVLFSCILLARALQLQEHEQARCTSDEQAVCHALAPPTEARCGGARQAPLFLILLHPLRTCCKGGPCVGLLASMLTPLKRLLRWYRLRKPGGVVQFPYKSIREFPYKSIRGTERRSSSAYTHPASPASERHAFA